MDISLLNSQTSVRSTSIAALFPSNVDDDAAGQFGSLIDTSSAPPRENCVDYLIRVLPALIDGTVLEWLLTDTPLREHLSKCESVGPDLTKLTYSWTLPEEEWLLSLDAAGMMLDSCLSELASSYRTFPTAEELAACRLTQTYATVVVGGREIARFDNQGGLWSLDFDASQITFSADAIGGSKVGPDVADWCARELAARVGGTVVKASTAITQDEFDALPPFDLGPKIDLQALRADPRYRKVEEHRAQLEDILQKRADFLGVPRSAIASPAVMTDEAFFKLD